MNRQGIHTDQFAKRAQQNGEPRRPAYGDENEENEERQQTRDDTPLSNIDLQHCLVHNAAVLVFRICRKYTTKVQWLD